MCKRANSTGYVEVVGLPTTTSPSATLNWSCRRGTFQEPVLEAIRVGDEQAFAAVTQRYRRQLHVHCYGLLGSFDDPDDLVQETLRAWRARASFEGRSLVRTWLYRIATNAPLNALERAPRRILPTGRGRATDRGNADHPRRAPSRRGHLSCPGFSHTLAACSTRSRPTTRTLRRRPSRARQLSSPSWLLCSICRRASDPGPARSGRNRAISLSAWCLAHRKDNCGRRT